MNKDDFNFYCAFSQIFNQSRFREIKDVDLKRVLCNKFHFVCYSFYKQALGYYVVPVVSPIEWFVSSHTFGTECFISCDITFRDPQDRQTTEPPRGTKKERT